MCFGPLSFPIGNLEGSFAVGLSWMGTLECVPVSVSVRFVWGTLNPVCVYVCVHVYLCVRVG